jgi:hypothetical protein
MSDKTALCDHTNLGIMGAGAEEVVMRQCSTRTRHLHRLQSCETAPPTYDIHDRILRGARRACSTTAYLDHSCSLAGEKTIRLISTEKVPTTRGLL